MTIQVGDILEGKVLNIVKYGVFVQLAKNSKGLIHISEISSNFVNDINTVLKSGDIVKVKVISNDNGKIALSLKQLENNNNNNWVNKRKVRDYDRYNRKDENKPKTFEDILNKFLKDSEERQVDIKRNFESKRGCSNKRM